MIKKILLIIIVIILLAIAGGYIYLTVSFPKVSPITDLKVNITPERFERGKYLVENVTNCFVCHSPRDYSRYSAPYLIETKGAGNKTDFTKNKGLPGNLYPGNITPSTLKSWTDGELLRAITEGVSKDGRALFPIMPYLNYGKMDKEDIYSIIAYIRSIRSIESNIPKTEIDFPMNIITNTLPTPAKFQKVPAKIDKFNYGRYLVNAASCNDCHTQKNKGKPLEGMKYAGGFKFILNDGSELFSSNITPHKETGIGSWSKENFVKRFKDFSVPLNELPMVINGGENTVMPWFDYAKMSEEDLGAIYDYLSQQEAVDYKVPE